TQTLVLTQTGFNSPPSEGSNFDTSDRVRLTAPVTKPCGSGTGASLCTVTIDLDTGSGLATVFSAPSGNPLFNNPINNFNMDDGSATHQEQAQWSSPVVSATNYTLQLGYADNVHGCTTGCFPNPFDGSNGTTPATRFIGAPTPATP